MIYYLDTHKTLFQSETPLVMFQDTILEHQVDGEGRDRFSELYISVRDARLCVEEHRIPLNEPLHLKLRMREGGLPWTSHDTISDSASAFSIVIVLTKLRSRSTYFIAGRIREIPGRDLLFLSDPEGIFSVKGALEMLNQWLETDTDTFKDPMLTQFREAMKAYLPQYKGLSSYAKD